MVKPKVLILINSIANGTYNNNGPLLPGMKKPRVLKVQVRLPLFFIDEKPRSAGQHHHQ